MDHIMPKFEKLLNSILFRVHKFLCFLGFANGLYELDGTFDSQGQNRAHHFWEHPKIIV